MSGEVGNSPRLQERIKAQLAQSESVFGGRPVAWDRDPFGEALALASGGGEAALAGPDSRHPRAVAAREYIAGRQAIAEGIAADEAAEEAKAAVKARKSPGALRALLEKQSPATQQAILEALVELLGGAGGSDEGGGGEFVDEDLEAGYQAWLADEDVLGGEAA
jgi:hypothetical protein